MPNREVLIDITRLLGRFMKGRLPTGVDRVSVAYVRHFADRARAVVRFAGRALVLPREASQELFARLPIPSADFNWTARWLIARQLLNPPSDVTLKGALFFNTGHSGLEHPSSVALLQRLALKPVFLVHDLIPITHPEYSRPGKPEKHVTRMDNALRRARGVITNSRATLDELERYAAKTGLTVPPAVAAPLAPAELPPPAAESPMAEPYFVVLGTIEPRKNHWLLLQMWRRLIERHGARAPRLVVIGRRGWECENVVDLLERCAELRGFVTELPGCSDGDVATYLRHARALLFPSFVEGYGMPLVEALSIGIPVVASDLPVFREIAGAIPDYLDPLDGVGWLARIEAYSAPDSPERDAQLGRVAKFVTPTWTEHFRIVDEFLDRLA